MRARGGMANGVFGCAVIGIVILASLGVAFLGNADERQVDTTDWNYVTSANPAFTYDNAPARVEYSPPANYTGYTTSSERSEYISGVTYTATSTPNSYMVKRAPVQQDLVNTDLAALYNSAAGLPPLNLTTEISQSGRNVVMGLDGHNTTWGAYLMQFGYWQRAIANLSAVELDSNITIEFNLTDDNAFFARASDYGMSYVVRSSPSPSHSEYDFAGATPCDRAVLNINGVVNLYSNGAYITTASASDVILGIANFDGTLDTTAPLDGAGVTITYLETTTEYMNPNDGVTIQSSIVELSDFANAPHVSYDQDTTVYNSVNFDGNDILDYAFYLGGADPVNVGVYMTVALGTEINISYGWHAWPNLGSDSGVYISAFSYTADTLGTQVVIHYMLDDESSGEFGTYEIHLYIKTVDSPATSAAVNWFNGYDNAAVNLLVKSFEGSVEISGVTIACASSSWTVGGVAVGTWPAVLVAFDMDAGVSVRPVSSMINFMSYELAGDSITINTTATAAIGSLSFSRDVAVNLAVVSTTVYLAGGGVYRVDSYLDVSAKFPNYTTYNVTINGAAHWGDSITINGQTCAVDKAAGTVEISGATFPLSGLVLAYSDSTFYYRGNVYEAGHLVAINDGLAVDLGAAAGLVLQFDGTWYYETALYSGAPGTVTVIDWTPGVLGLDASAFAAVFTLLALVGLVLASRLGGGTWDYIVLGSAVLVGFIMCGVFI